MNIIEEALEIIKNKDSEKLGIDLTLENSNLSNVFTLIEVAENMNIHPLWLQNEKVSVALELVNTVGILELKSINITSVKRKILDHIAKFYPLDVLSKDIKIKSFKLYTNFKVKE